MSKGRQVRALAVDVVGILCVVRAIIDLVDSEPLIPGLSLALSALAVLCFSQATLLRRK